MTDFRHRLGLVGAGRMGRALVRALITRGVLEPQEIIAADIAPAALATLADLSPGVGTTADAGEAASGAQVLIVAVKPQDYQAALAPALLRRPPDQLVVSVMAGVSLAALARELGPRAPLVRVMPNIVCEVAEGAFGYAVNEAVSDEQKALIHQWLNQIGAAEELPESLLDAVTGLSGSGPAFAAVFMEALADGGVAAGLPRPTAQRLAAQTLLGAARWVLELDGPSALKDAVCSPGGTTIAGLRSLEERGLRSAVMEAVVAAAERARTLGSA